MKIFNISKNGKMYLIGEKEEETKWYLVTAKVAEEAKKYKIGDEVDIQSNLQGSSYYLNFIGKPGSVAKPSNTETPVSEKKEPTQTTHTNTSEKKYWGKSLEERNDIKRQAIAHATSRVLQGIVTPDNVIELMDKVYKKFTELVG